MSELRRTRIGGMEISEYLHWNLELEPGREYTVAPTGDVEGTELLLLALGIAAHHRYYAGDEVRLKHSDDGELWRDGPVLSAVAIHEDQILERSLRWRDALRKILSEPNTPPQEHFDDALLGDMWREVNEPHPLMLGAPMHIRHKFKIESRVPVVAAGYVKRPVA